MYSSKDTINNQDFITWTKEIFSSPVSDAPRKIIVKDEEAKQWRVENGMPPENIDVMTEDIADQLTEVFPRFLIESMIPTKEQDMETAQREEIALSLLTDLHSFNLLTITVVKIIGDNLGVDALSLCYDNGITYEV